MKIRIESNSSSGQNRTGVGYYTKRLTDSLGDIERAEVCESQFDFLNRKLSKASSIEKINFPQKLYAKLHYLGVAPPFDLTLGPTDITLFPNYALWPTMRSRKSAVTIHDLSYLKFPEVVESKNLAYLQKIVPRAVKKADLVLTVSETVKQEIIDSFNIPASKIHVTPIPPTETYSIPSDRPVRETYGIPTEKYVLFASTIEPRKNLDALLDAYVELPGDIKDSLSLVVAGGMGWKSDAIKTRLESLKKEHPHIVTTGYYDQQDAAALFQQASIFVMPSLYEGFGMPLLEAMAAQTPTIASDIAVLREVGGSASTFFDPAKPTQLRDCIVRLLESEELRNESVKAGLVNLERYSWDKVANDLVKKFEEILTSPTNSRNR